MKWATKTLGDICEITSSRRIFAHEYVSDGVPFYRGKEVVEKFNGAQALSTELFISRNRFEEIADKHGAPREGDILLTSVGTLGVPYFVGPGEEFYFKDGNLTWFRPGKESDSAFLYYWLLTPQGRAELGKSTIGTSQSAYTIELLKKMQISLPAVAEQAELASTLSAYDDLIENNRRRMALLEESARLLYREWFVRLRFPGYEHTRIVDGVPEGWAQVRVDDFGTVLTGKTPATKDSDNYGGDIPFVKTPDMHGHAFVLQSETYLTEKGAKSQAKKFLPPGALLVSCIGTVGVVSLTSETCQFNQQINAVIPNEDFLRYYCYNAFKDMKPRLDAIGGGVTMANVSKGKFESMDLLRPSLPLLRNFDEFCTPAFSQIKVLGQQNQKLRAARDLLLPSLMNGGIVV